VCVAKISSNFSFPFYSAETSGRWTSAAPDARYAATYTRLRSRRRGRVINGTKVRTRVYFSIREPSGVNKCRRMMYCASAKRNKEYQYSRREGCFHQRRCRINRSRPTKFRCKGRFSKNGNIFSLFLSVSITEINNSTLEIKSETEIWWTQNNNFTSQKDRIYIYITALFSDFSIIMFITESCLYQFHFQGVSFDFAMSYNESIFRSNKLTFHALSLLRITLTRYRLMLHVINMSNARLSLTKYYTKHR